MNDLSIFTGNANPQLAAKVAKYLNLTLGKALVNQFSDGETMVEIVENVRGQACFIIQSTCAPCNDNIMELLIMADALRRASATSITAVVPYFGYARQDRRARSLRVPISAKVIADLIAAVGITHLITVDLHADQIQGFFNMPVDNVYATPVMLADVHKLNLTNPLIVAPDVGGVVRARAFAKRLSNSDLIIIDKRRPSPNQAEVMNVIGGDIENQHCIIVDDMVDTAGTLCHASRALKDRGAKTVRAYCTHAVLSGNAVENMTQSALDELVVTDTIPLSEPARNCHKIRVLSLSDMLAETIYRVRRRESVSSLFLD